MFTKHILPVLAAIGTVAAQSTCSVAGGTTTINSQADATGLAGCRTVRGSVVIAPGSGRDIDISGPSQITGDLLVEDNGVLQSFSSDDLTIIGGEFKMRNVTLLATLDMKSLTKVKTLSWTTLNRLDIPSMRITEAEEILIQDTFVSDLSGVNVASLRKMDINNNARLSDYTSNLGNLSDILIFKDNGEELKLNLPDLKWIANMTIANVTEFTAPSLAVVNGSARFDFNKFTTLSFPNLTSTRSGDLSFIGNSAVSNISFPRLTSIGGGLLIANNTKLGEIDGLPVLKSVGGAIKLRGSFKEFGFPALNDVKGAVDVSSTEDIQPSCDALQKLASKKDGGNGVVQGPFNCDPLNAKANEDTSSGTSGGSNTKKDSAAGVAINTAILGLAAFVGVAHAFL